MLDAVSVELSIALLIVVGMALTRMKWIDEAGSKLLSRLTVNVGLSALIVSNMLTEFTREKLVGSADGVLAGYLAIGAMSALGVVVARIARVAENRRGAFVCMFAYSNSVFIGLPVAVALFGVSATPYALLYYVVNTSLFWSVGNYLMSRDGGQRGKPALKSLLPAPLVAFLISMLLILLDVRLPNLLMKTAGYLGGMVTPLSLIYTGFVLMRMIERGSLRWQKGYTPMLIGRFVLAPALMLLSSMLVPVAAVEVRNVLLVQSAMPVMTQTTILAGNWNADAEYVAGGLLISMIASLLVIPALMGIIPYL